MTHCGSSHVVDDVPASTEFDYAFMAQNKRPTLDVTFGPFPLSFPNITKPDEKYDVYTANAVDDPNSAAMKAARKIFNEAIEKFGLDADDCKLPLVEEMRKDPNAPEGTRKPKKVKTGKLVLKSKSKRPPAVFDSKGREINPKGLEIRGGTIARVQGFISPYDMNGEEGISFTLTGVQIIKLAEGRTSAGFGAFDDGDEDGWTMSEDDADGLDAGDDDNAADDAGALDI